MDIYLGSSRLYGLFYYVSRVPIEPIRREWSTLVGSIAFYASILFPLVLKLCLGDLSLWGIILYGFLAFVTLIFAILGISLLLYTLPRVRNAIKDTYYNGIHAWDLTRLSTTVPTYDVELLSPFDKYLPSDSVLARIALTLEHFIPRPFEYGLVNHATMLRDFRRRPISVFFPIFLSDKKIDLFVEAFRSDLDAHMAMKDCYRLIHANALISELDLKSISILPSSVTAVDYPSLEGDSGRKGLVRIYHPSNKAEDINQFPQLIPNDRLPQGPLFLSFYSNIRKQHDAKEIFGSRNLGFIKESVILKALEELLQLCLQQKNFFALQWDNIYFEYGDEKSINPTLKIRSMVPEITTEISECGIVCEALLQWASILGSQEQLAWLDGKLDYLVFDKSLGSEDSKPLPDMRKEEETLESIRFLFQTSEERTLEERALYCPEFDKNKSSSVRVMLTDYEKNCIRRRISLRAKELEAFRKYEENVFKKYSLNRSFDNIYGYESLKIRELKQFFNERLRQNALWSSLPEEIKSKTRLSVIKSCAHWLGKSMHESKDSDFMYRNDYMGLRLGWSFCLRMTWIAEPGIEPWYRDASQSKEILAALLALQHGGYISLVRPQTETPEKITILL
ncbi:hypothetical protein [Chlamydia sp. 17-3921]|uniref:hypothetical protein n=1 Tax=Chlamydia sp. 17-3921 TaxID=2675798 RepID=UPI00191972B5|nr:hypothetical protein [Chlamydia sp. 17-3921]